MVRAAEAAAVRDDLPAAENGIYVAVTGRPGEPLAFDSLSRPSDGIELVGAFQRDGHLEATVFVPVEAKDRFPKLVEEYRAKNVTRDGVDTGKPRNRRLVEGIQAFRLAALSDLWADDPQLFPQAGVSFRWETWLRANTLDRFRAEAKRFGLSLGPAPLHFPETDVVLVHATPEQMADLSDRTLCVALVRRSSTTADFFDSLPAPDQADHVCELLGRIRTRPPEHVRATVCLLDTGVNAGHPLLSPFIDPTDCYAVEPAWGPTDTRGHGTELAGVAVYGDLTAVLDGAGTVDVPHRLESVKIIPPRGATEYDQLGSVTQSAVEYAEFIGADRQRVYCLATTTDEDTPHDGFPSAWSSVVDQLAAGIGVPGHDQRLFCVSGGNIRAQNITVSAYPSANDEAEIETPGQAWNAITVGAYTDKIVITDGSLAGWRPLAAQGDLCPDSRCGCWEGGWPIKPEIVLEGGNRAIHPSDGIGYSVPDLGILTTSKDHPVPSFATTRATSPATAEAARLAALISDAYPDLWPETVRALVVGSSSWTPAMVRHLPPVPQKSDYGRLLRRYGYGVPDLDRALRSVSNCLSLIAQDSLQPYRWSERSRGAVINEMKLYELPWPRKALLSLQTTEVTMRVTLSYFVEPNPSETARGRKLRYASHGLRFKVIRPDEAVDEFRARINRAAAEEVGGTASRGSDSQSWLIGSQQRDVGSIHSDIWRGPASDLARRSIIAVHPVGGWWKERAHLDRWASSARFALVVTIDAGDVDVDIHTPVATMVANMTAVQT
ncbi:S8 family peptidase [Azospirillum argentinense]